MTDEALQQELEKLKADIAQLRSDLGSLNETVREAGRERLAEARARAREKAEDTREALKTKVDEALATGQKVVEDLDARVTQNPMGSLLAAFGVGFVIAQLMNWSSRR